MRRTLASPILAISSNSPSAIFAEALSASIRTARRGERSLEGMTFPKRTRQRWSGIRMSRPLPPELISFNGARRTANAGSGRFHRRRHTTQGGRQFRSDLAYDASDLGQPGVGDAAGQTRDGDRGERLRKRVVDHGRDAAQAHLGLFVIHRATLLPDRCELLEEIA